MNNISSISIVFERMDDDLIISKDEINKFEISKYENENKYNYLFNKINIQFNLRDSYNETIIQSLLFHEFDIKNIVVEYEDRPGAVYSRYSTSEDEMNIKDYVTQVSNSNNQMNISLFIESILKANALKVNKKDVRIMSAKDRLNNRLIKSNETAGLLFVNKCATYTKINLAGLNPLAVIGSKRIELSYEESEWKVKDENDLKYIEEYFMDKDIDYQSVLKRINNRIIDDIKSKTSLRGCNVAYIHHYKYRINKQYNMFNVLVEWSYSVNNNCA